MGPECASAGGKNTFLKIKTEKSPWHPVEIGSFEVQVSWFFNHRPTIFVRKILFKLLPRHLWGSSMSSMFSKIPCFQHILLNTFRPMRLKQYSGSCLKLQKPHCKNLRWKYIKTDSQKSCLRNKEQKANVSSCFSIGRAFSFTRPIGRPCKIAPT